MNALAPNCGYFITQVTNSPNFRLIDYRGELIELLRLASSGLTYEYNSAFFRNTDIKLLEREQQPCPQIFASTHAFGMDLYNPKPFDKVKEEATKISGVFLGHPIYEEKRIPLVSLAVRARLWLGVDIEHNELIHRASSKLGEIGNYLPEKNLSSIETVLNFDSEDFDSRVLFKLAKKSEANEVFAGVDINTLAPNGFTKTGIYIDCNVASKVPPTYTEVPEKINLQWSEVKNIVNTLSKKLLDVKYQW